MVRQEKVILALILPKLLLIIIISVRKLYFVYFNKNGGLLIQINSVSLRRFVTKRT